MGRTGVRHHRRDQKDMKVYRYNDAKLEARHVDGSRLIIDWRSGNMRCIEDAEARYNLPEQQKSTHDGKRQCP